MNNGITEMIDMVFDLDGGTLPATYPFLLWPALMHHAPALAEAPAAGLLPLRGAGISEGLLLSKRAKLVMRVPAILASHTGNLAGRQIDLAGRSLHLGVAKQRSIQPFPTLRADLVAGEDDEVQFMESIRRQLGELKIKGRLICGRRRMIGDGQQSVTGFSLVVHDLKPEASLHLQYAGLGDKRRFGCGIFLPSKVISGLDED